jgi:hypothetical protein
MNYCCICGLFIYPDEDAELTDDGLPAHTDCIEEEENQEN